MGKLYNFLLGVVVGFGLYHAAINYHVVYAKDGLHLINKTPPRLSETYVDVRDFSAGDWAQHPELILALKKAGKDDILAGATADAVNDAINRGLDKVLGPAN